MEWIIGGAIAFASLMYSIFHNGKDDVRDTEKRLADIEAKVAVMEQRIETVGHDIEELKSLTEQITIVREDLVEIKTIVKYFFEHYKDEHKNR
ncbi:hypothetical protein VC636_25600 [Citrobacter freundii]|uniref:hypothetical protein n=1 Tax=Citrobacter freundii TaxID=546 RepID=UPI00292BF782|nr:hypothetical protein [Citrobacter freundii]MDV0678306.1 hypothetical protein [Citrobacter freundii]MDV0860798.1 hypothetical protein [Citrobacter freundii]MEB0577839.1 hypothetical protein [Citrobacter freundii]MEB0714285.1 hypothetical protein [Citrobacter freundii]